MMPLWMEGMILLRQLGILCFKGKLTLLQDKHFVHTTLHII